MYPLIHYYYINFNPALNSYHREQVLYTILQTFRPPLPHNKLLRHCSLHLQLPVH